MGGSLGKDVHEQLYTLVAAQCRKYLQETLLSTRNNANEPRQDLLAIDLANIQARFKLRYMTENLVQAVLWYTASCLKVRYRCGKGRFVMENRLIREEQEVPEEAEDENSDMITEIVSNPQLYQNNRGPCYPPKPHRKQNLKDPEAAMLEVQRGKEKLQTKVAANVAMRLTKITRKGLKQPRIWECEKRINKYLHTSLTAMLNEARVTDLDTKINATMLKQVAKLTARSALDCFLKDMASAIAQKLEERDEQEEASKITEDENAIAKKASGSTVWAADVLALLQYVQARLPGVLSESREADKQAQRARQERRKKDDEGNDD